MRTDRTVTWSDQVANKDEQWPSIHEANCGQTDTCENITFPRGR